MRPNPTDHLGLVGYWAGKFARQPQDFDDVFSMGMLGLLKACQLFDPGRGAAFSTYASLLIRQAIVRELKQTQPMIRVPHQWALDRRIPVTSLNRQLPGDDTELGDMVPGDDAHEATTAARIDALATRQRVHAALGRLPRRDAEVLRLRYGIRDDGTEGYPLTLAEVGRVLRVTRERVRQIQLRAERRLARRLAG